MQPAGKVGLNPGIFQVQSTSLPSLFLSTSGSGLYMAKPWPVWFCDGCGHSPHTQTGSNCLGPSRAMKPEHRKSPVSAVPQQIMEEGTCCLDRSQVRICVQDRDPCESQSKCTDATQGFNCSVSQILSWKSLNASIYPLWDPPGSAYSRGRELTTSPPHTHTKPCKLPCLFPDESHCFCLKASFPSPASSRR